MTFKPEDYLMKVKGGADYLEVKWRIVWFRDEHPDGQIETSLVEHTSNEKGVNNAVFKASASYLTKDADGNNTYATASSHGSEESTDFGDYIEKAETKAIGRALAALGYGTQFCADHEFGADKGRVVDAPVASKGNAGGGAVFACEDCGTVIKDTTNKQTGSLFTAEKKAEISKSKYGKTLCWSCQKNQA